MLLTGQGRKDAFIALVRRNQGPLVNFFRRMGVRNDDEDLAQETFVKLFNYRERYRPKAKFTTFLYLVARRVHVDYVRRRAREREKRNAWAEEAAMAAEQPNRYLGQEARVTEALAALSEEMRNVLVLNIWQGLTYQEIADALEIPLGTVKTRMFHAMRKLRKAMGHAV